MKLQAATEQRPYKISYDVDPKLAPTIKEIRTYLRKLDLHAKIVYSHNAYLDLLPVRASKGLALQYLTIKWGLDRQKILVAGDSGNDEEMLRGNTLGVIVGNYSKELSKLRGLPDIFFAQGAHAWGILEGINHYRFLENLTNDPNHSNDQQETNQFSVVTDA